MRVLFFGTPEFAVDSLEDLADSRHNIVAVVCQPDRRAGRGRRMEKPPVARTAEARGIPIVQPERLSAGDVWSIFEEYSPEIGVVVAYGKILPRRVLEIPPRGFVNVHASLLPWHRGAAPIARAILAGDAETGVSIMQLDEGVDTGPVYAVRKTDIDPDETAGELGARLAHLGAGLLLEVLEGIEAGSLAPRPQEGEPSYAPPLAKEDGRIAWTGNARDVHDRVRGTNPWPGATARFRDGEVRIWRTALAPVEDSGPPGEVLRAKKNLLRVASASGAVDLLELQRPGKKRVSARDFINGARVKPGERFG